MSSNFIYCTDIHLRTHNPSRRTDANILQTVLDKITGIGELAKKLKSTAIICGGDLGHWWDWKLSTVRQVEAVINDLPVPFYSIVGNHDVPGKSISLLDHTGLGTLFRLGAIKRLTHNIIGDFEFYGFDADTEETEKLISESYANKNENKTDKLQVAIVHAPVGNTPSQFAVGHKSLSITGFDIALFGDIHEGFSPYKLSTGCIVANPGALFRQKIDERHIDPAVFVVYSNGTIKKKFIEAKNYKEVFDLSGIEDIKKIKMADSMSKAVATALKNKDLNPKQLVTKIGKELKVKKEVIDLVLGELEC